MESKEKEARFDIYCRFCKDAETPGFVEPCDECLATPAVEDSHKPVNFKQATAMVNYRLPDPNVDAFTRDFRKTTKWFWHRPTDEELKKYFEKHDDGDWYEKREEE